MTLLRAHKILICAAVALGAVLALWGVAHRGQSGGWAVAVVGAAMVPVGLLYLRKLIRNPPL